MWLTRVHAYRCVISSVSMVNVTNVRIIISTVMELAFRAAFYFCNVLSALKMLASKAVQNNVVHAPVSILLIVLLALTVIT